MLFARQWNPVQGALKIAVVITMAAGVVSCASEASKVAATPVAQPLSNQKYHVNYEVNADGSYTELNEIVLHVVNEQGVQFAKHIPAGMPMASELCKKREVDVLSAYTLKKNGRHVDATQINPAEWNSRFIPPVGAAQNLFQVKVMAFQEVAVGDDLIFSYRVSHKEPAVPGNVVIDLMFAKFLLHDDLEISLKAPASLNLRIETAMFKTAKIMDIGGVRNWQWKYQNNQAESLPVGKTNPLGSFSKIHISSFTDQAAEMADLRAMMPKSPTPEEIFAPRIKEAEAGNADLQFSLGNAYFDGIGLNKDTAKAIAWYQKAAGHGHANASLVLGNIYMYGQGVTRDTAKAAAWYQKAVEQGGRLEAVTETRFGLMYETGDGVAKDAAKAVQWYQKAAVQGYGFAQFYLSLMYERGMGVPKDMTKAEEWLQKAAAQGWEGTTGMNTYPHLSPDRIKAVEWFKKGAERGSSSAQYRLAEIYEYGMGEIYGYGSGEDNDSEKAFEWFKRAAMQGHVLAQYSLATMYRYGKGVAVNAEKAVEWYRKAADRVDGERQKGILETIKQMQASGEMVDRNGPAADIHFVSAIGIGPVKLGMTLAEAKKLLPARAKFEQAENAEGADLISVEIDSQYLMILRPDKENPSGTPIDWSRRITYIETFDPECHTAEGVHPDSRIRDVEKVLGKTKEVTITEIESREFIDFEKQSKRFLFRSDYVGGYANDNARQTTKSNPDGKLMSIMISSDFSE